MTQGRLQSTTGAGCCQHSVNHSLRASPALAEPLPCGKGQYADGSLLCSWQAVVSPPAAAADGVAASIDLGGGPRQQEREAGSS